MNYHDTIEKFFEVTSTKYIIGWQENEVPDFPIMHLLKKNKDDEKYSVAIVPLTVPGGLPKEISPMELVKPIIKEFTPDAYIVFSEAWTVDINKVDKSFKNLKHGDLEYMKNRKEKLFIVGRSMDDKQHFQKIFLITRDHRTMKKSLSLENPLRKLVSSKFP